MIQRYTMLFWKNPCESSLEEIVDTSYNLLNLLKQFDTALSPKYLTAYNKGDIREFVFTRSNLFDLLEKSTNKEGNNTYLDLGRSISFFSSKFASESSGIRLTIGVNNKKAKNTFIVKPPYDVRLLIVERIDEFERLFKQIVEVFNPFWGCVYSNLTYVPHEQLFWKDARLSSVHWMNYFDNTTADTIGKDRMLSLPGIQKLEHGYYLKIQDALFDAEFPNHLTNLNKVNNLLGLV